MPPLAPEELVNNRAAFQLMTVKQFPWSREVWATPARQLFAAGARLVMFDFVFSPPNEGDPRFMTRWRNTATELCSGANIDIAAPTRLSRLTSS